MQIAFCSRLARFGSLYTFLSRPPTSIRHRRLGRQSLLRLLSISMLRRIFRCSPCPDDGNAYLFRHANTPIRRHRRPCRIAFSESPQTPVSSGFRGTYLLWDTYSRAVLSPARSRLLRAFSPAFFRQASQRT